MINKKTLIVRIIVFVIALAGFGVISYFMATNRISAFDDMIRYPVYNMRNPVLTAILKTITYIGNWQTVTSLSVLLIIIRKTRINTGLPAGLAALASNFVKSKVKDHFRRPRPDKALHIIKQGGYSFPSGHAMTGLVFYGMLAYSIRKEMHTVAEQAPLKSATLKHRADIVTGLLVALALLIGFSRIYVGVHYPSDVLAGWCLGTAILMVAFTIMDIISKAK